MAASCSTERFLQQDTAAFATTLNEIQKLEASQVVVKLQTAQSQLSAQQDALKEEQETQHKLQEQLKTSRQKLEHYQHGFLTNIFRSDKEKQRKVEKHYAAQQAEEEGLVASAKNITALRNKIQQLTADCRTLDVQAHHLQVLRQQAAGQVLQMFCSPYWQADPAYQQLQQACQRLDGEVAAARASAEAFGRAKPLLDRAIEKLRSALRSAEWAQREGYRSMQEGMRERMHQPGFPNQGRPHYSSEAACGSMSLSAARRRVQKAAQAIMEARIIIPNLPHIQEALVTRFLAGTFINDTIAGIIIINEAQQARSQITTMMQQVDSCRAWITSSLGTAQARLSQVEAAGAQKTAELEAFRWAQAQAAVQACRSQQQQQQPPHPPPVPDGEPIYDSTPSAPPIAMGWPVEQVK